MKTFKKIIKSKKAEENAPFFETFMHYFIIAAIIIILALIIANSTEVGSKLLANIKDISPFV